MPRTHCRPKLKYPWVYVGNVGRILLRNFTTVDRSDNTAQRQSRRRATLHPLSRLRQGARHTDTLQRRKIRQPGNGVPLRSRALLVAASEPCGAPAQ